MIDRLAMLARKPEKLVVGLMSGTSMDGIDAALVRLRGSGLDTEAILLHFVCLPYEVELRARLLRAAGGEPLPAAEHARLDFQVAARFAGAALAVAAGAGLSGEELDLIGSHGQTLFHHGGGTGAWDSEMATWQAGSVPVIAALAGVPTIGDFRSADVALGGTGAPLVPYVDFLLRRSERESRVLLNLGGIANLTYLRAGCGLHAVLAWDVGPGNMLLDALARELLGCDRDTDGAHAAGGRADIPWVETLLQEGYFRRAAPKSAGREEFGAEYAGRLRREGAGRGLGAGDLLATAVEITARSVALACTRPPLAGQPVDAVYVSGGGRRNAAVMRRLQELLSPASVRGLEALGVDTDAKEAVDFAVLANEALAGHAGNLPRVTGASRPCILGVIAPAGIRPRDLASRSEPR